MHSFLLFVFLQMLYNHHCMINTFYPYMLPIHLLLLVYLTHFLLQFYMLHILVSLQHLLHMLLFHFLILLNLCCNYNHLVISLDYKIVMMLMSLLNNHLQQFQALYLIMFHIYIPHLFRS